jgi:hypothetical protein
MVKLIQYWDLDQCTRREFGEFFRRDFAAAINASGLMKVAGSWEAASGEGPRFITESTAASAAEVEELILSQDYLSLRDRLSARVVNCHSKLLVPTGRATPGAAARGLGNKFSQHFNVNPPEYFEFDRFMKEEYLPGLERLGLEIAGDWRVRVGDSPHNICEVRADDLGAIGQAIQSPAFLALSRQLLQLVSDYGCKVLIPSGFMDAAAIT